MGKFDHLNDAVLGVLKYDEFMSKHDIQVATKLSGPDVIFGLNTHLYGGLLEMEHGDEARYRKKIKPDKTSWNDDPETPIEPLTDERISEMCEKWYADGSPQAVACADSLVALFAKLPPKKDE